MVREALKVLLLLLKLLLELLELLPLALTNSHVLAGAFTALEGVAVSGKFRSVIDIALASTDDRAPGLSMIVFSPPKTHLIVLFSEAGTQLTLGHQSWGEHRYHLRPWPEQWW